MPPYTTPEPATKFRAAGEKMLLVIRSFSKKERMLFVFFLSTALVSFAGILSLLNQSFMIDIPVRDGSLTEGIVGTPRFINPVLAVSDADKDLTMLTYSGLMRKGTDGALVSDIAQEYVLSQDGREYTFTLRNGVRWSDGKAFTADDIVFTIEKIQDASIRSPKKSAWEGVTVRKIDERTVKFALKQPYAPFIENTTLGIVPKHIWGGLSPDQWSFSSYNTNPVGTGPYIVTKIQQNSSGIPEYYDLVPSSSFILGEPYIENIRIRFYANDETLIAGYKAGEVQSVGALSPEYAAEIGKTGARIERTPLPRVFSVFFNQTEQPLFIAQTVRDALNTATDKERIIQEVLLGYGTEANGPMPAGVVGSESGETTAKKYADKNARTEAARTLLQKKGWTINPDTNIFEQIIKKKPTESLAFTLATSDAPELKAVANILKEDWEKMGATVKVDVYESGDLNQNIIRTRKYDALLFGEIVGTDPDPYAFWHSSQRFDPGLNIALYANLTVDKLLEKARETSDREKRTSLYEDFQKEVINDAPAVFLYSPDFIYILPKEIRGVSLQGVNVSSDRFATIHEWYARTQKVWPPFANFH